MWYDTAMPEPENDERALSRAYSWVPLALAGIAGAVDGIGYVVVFNVFTSHMSGNTVRMAVELGRGDWAGSWKHFEPIVAFFIAVCIGLAIADTLAARNINRLFSTVALLECVLLAAFFAVARPAQQWMVILPAGAMGLQNAMLRRVGNHRVRTTFVTGMLTNTAQGLVDSIQAVLRRSGEARGKFTDFGFYGAIWLSFAAGGVIGVALLYRFHVSALWAPIAGLLALAALDLVHPLAEHQGERGAEQS